MTQNEVLMVNKIKGQYASTPEKSKIDCLKELHKSTKRKATVFSYIFGTLSSLVLGTGMSLAMVVIGSGTPLMVAGIAIGVLGLILCGINYPIYNKMVARARRKNADKIIALSDEILNNN